MRFLLWLAIRQKRRILTGSLLSSAWMVAMALPPYLLSRAVDDGLAAHDSGALTGWTAAMLAAGVGSALLGMAQHRTTTKVRMDAMFRTVRAIMDQALRLGGTLPRRVATGEVVAIGLSDARTISQAMSFAGPGIGAVVGYVVVAFVLADISLTLALVVLAGAPLLAVVIGPLLSRVLSAGDDYRERQGALTARLVDVVAGLRVLNGLGGKEMHADRYRRRSRELCQEGYRVGAATSWVGALSGGLPLLFLALVTWLGARMAAEGSLTIGDLVAAYGYVAMLAIPMTVLIMGGSDLARGVVAARRVTGFLALAPGRTGPATTADAPAGPAVLHDPASGVEVPPGLFIVLTGARPADAAAVVERLGRFEDSDVLWGGVRLDAVPLAQVRERILVADNDADLFAGTVREVVSGRGHPEDSAVRAAIHAAAAADIVDALPDGLDSVVAARGLSLSGGQRQRLRLARALCAGPEVLLAVEPTSAVDAHTEAVMAARLRTARAGLTTVVTGTSPFVLEQADVVVHLVDGRVAATGTHRELLENAPGYRALVSRDTDAAEEAHR